mgnify:CR=1 FL=1
MNLSKLSIILESALFRIMKKHYLTHFFTSKFEICNGVATALRAIQ